MQEKNLLLIIYLIQLVGFADKGFSLEPLRIINILLFVPLTVLMAQYYFKRG